LRCLGHFCIDGENMLFLVVSVGSNKPQSFALVVRADVISAQNLPPRIIPERGKVTEDSGQTSGNKHR